MRRAKCRACLAEFDFRYQHKDISDHERADKALIGSFGKRLTYRRTNTKPNYFQPPRWIGECRKRWTHS
jgi:hypothetical protein